MTEYEVVVIPDDESTQEEIKRGVIGSVSEFLYDHFEQYFDVQLLDGGHIRYSFKMDF